jgi:hypothetical protein
LLRVARYEQFSRPSSRRLKRINDNDFVQREVKIETHEQDSVPQLPQTSPPLLSPVISEIDSRTVILEEDDERGIDNEHMSLSPDSGNNCVTFNGDNN